MRWIALAPLALLLACLPTVEHAEGDWGVNLDDALKAAAENNRGVLLDFTGSDWCPPCQALHRRVLNTRPFVDYADENLELVLVDFPRRNPLPKKQAEANAALAKRFNVNGFPVLLLLDATGRERTRLDGYGGEEAEDVIRWLEKNRAK